MARNLRTHGKNTVVWLLLGMLVLGLGGYGVSNFSGVGPGVIGAVGQTEITAREYAMALRGQIDAIAGQQGGQRPTVAQLAQTGIDRATQGQLFAGAAFGEAARKMGISAGDDEVARQLTAVPAFQGPDGQFNRAAYADALKRQGMKEADFEAALRQDAARGIVQAGVIGGVAAPAAMLDSYTAWLTETRDLGWVELTPGDLPSPMPAPTDEELATYHQTHAEDFTRPEARHISYVLLTPEMLSAATAVDETALRKLYEARLSDYVQPARRMVELLVYPDADQAAAARARLDAGAVSFADLAGERGLTLADIDRGAVSEAELGAAGPAVFATEDNGIVGPVETDLGPALVSVNAILEPVNISFEDAREELSAEAAVDQARRDIAEQATGFEDLLAGGATLEDVARETPMEMGEITLSADSNEGLAGYPAFRAAAMEATQDDFPRLFTLEDGGVAALRLDSIDPAALEPLDQVREAVASAWMQSEMTRRLSSRAVEIAASVDAGNSLSEQGFAVQSRSALGRDDFLPDLPDSVVIKGFALPMPGTAAEATQDGRVFVVALDAVHAGGEGERATMVRAALEQRLSQGLAADLGAYFARAVQDEAGITVDSAMVNAVNAQVN